MVQSQQGACPPLIAAQSTPHLPHSHQFRLCTAALPRGPLEPARYTGQPDTAKHQGSNLTERNNPSDGED